MDLHSYFKSVSSSHQSCSTSIDSSSSSSETESDKSTECMGGDQCQKYLFPVDVQTYF